MPFLPWIVGGAVAVGGWIFTKKGVENAVESKTAKFLDTLPLLVLVAAASFWVLRNKKVFGVK